jgi:hypothetical protein
MKDDESSRKESGALRSVPADNVAGMTRREWLAEVGMAALATGLPASIEAAKPAQATSALPPGLYLPSSEHLGHVLEQDELFHPLPAGSQTDYAPPVSGLFRPAFFSENEFHVVRRIVELILGLPQEETGQASQAVASELTEKDREDPVEGIARWFDLQMASAAAVRRAAQTLSPEHRTVAAHYYGPEAMHRLETEEPDRTCHTGLVWLEERSRQKYGAEFVSLNEPQQIEIIGLASKVSKTETGDREGIRFFELLRDVTIRGYYTSRVGLRELDYKGNSFYVESPGCPSNGEP